MEGGAEVSESISQRLIEAAEELCKQSYRTIYASNGKSIAAAHHAEELATKARKAFKSLTQEVEERYKLFDEIKQLDFKSNAIQYERESLWRQLFKRMQEAWCYAIKGLEQEDFAQQNHKEIEELRRKLGLGEE